MGLGMSKKRRNSKDKKGKTASDENVDDDTSSGRIQTQHTKSQRKASRQVVKLTKESRYPRLSEFPYTKPKLVLPRNRPPKPAKEPSYIKFSYNCFENNSYSQVPRYRENNNLCTFCGSGFPKLECDLTNQLAWMEQGPSGRHAAARRHEEMVQIRDRMRMCNKALHLRQAFNQNKFNDP